jgi:hypothetical protein
MDPFGAPLSLTISLIPAPDNPEPRINVMAASSMRARLP